MQDLQQLLKSWRSSIIWNNPFLINFYHVIVINLDRIGLLLFCSRSAQLQIFRYLNFSDFFYFIFFRFYSFILTKILTVSIMMRKFEFRFNRLKLTSTKIPRFTSIIFSQNFLNYPSKTNRFTGIRPLPVR